MQFIVLWWETGEWTGHKHWPYNTQGSCKGEASLPLIEQLCFSLLLSLSLCISRSLLPFFFPLSIPLLSSSLQPLPLSVFLSVSLLTVTARVSGLQTRAPCLIFPLSHSSFPPILPLAIALFPWLLLWEAFYPLFQPPWCIWPQIWGRQGQETGERFCKRRGFGGLESGFVAGRWTASFYHTGKEW